MFFYVINRQIIKYFLPKSSLQLVRISVWHFIWIKLTKLVQITTYLIKSTFFGFIKCHLHFGTITKKLVLTLPKLLARLSNASYYLFTKLKLFWSLSTAGTILTIYNFSTMAQLQKELQPDGPQKIEHNSLLLWLWLRMFKLEEKQWMMELTQIWNKTNLFSFLFPVSNQIYRKVKLQNSALNLSPESDWSTDFTALFVQLI